MTAWLLLAFSTYALFIWLILAFFAGAYGVEDDE